MTWNAVAPLAPLIFLNALFIICLPLYALRVARHGMPSAEGAKKHSGLIGQFLQGYLMWMMGPIERALVRHRVSPNALTALSVVLSLGASLSLAMGHFGRGGWLYLFNGIVDIFDGRVARSTGRVSDAGAFADSVADRLAEALIFSGLAWYYRSTWVLGLVLGAMATSYLVSYTRARGEGLGITGADIGRMQRPERILFLGLGLVLSPVVTLFVPHDVAVMRWPTVVGLALVALASAGTALRRFRYVFGTLDRRAPKPVRALRSVTSKSQSVAGPTDAPSAANISHH